MEKLSFDLMGIQKDVTKQQRKKASENVEAKTTDTGFLFILQNTTVTKMLGNLQVKIETNEEMDDFECDFITKLSMCLIVHLAFQRPGFKNV